MYAIPKLERSQHKFLRNLAKRIGQPMSPILHNYGRISNQFKIPTLKSLLKCRDIAFVFKCAKNDSNSLDFGQIFVYKKLECTNRVVRPLEEKF